MKRGDGNGCICVHGIVGHTLKLTPKRRLMSVWWFLGVKNGDQKRGVAGTTLSVPIVPPR